MGDVAEDKVGLVDRLIAWEGRKRVGGSLSNAARPWLVGFVRYLGLREARLLLV